MNFQPPLDYFKTLQALYVEDDTVIRENVGASLGCYFNNVITAASYDEALNIYDNETIDMLFVDIEMPGRSGIDLVEMIRKDDKKTPIVMVTAYSDTQYLLKLIPQNIQHYMVKPVTLERLEKALFETLPYLGKDKLALALCEDVIYFPKEGIVRSNDQDTYFSSRERKLMNLLVEHRNHVVSYVEIENEVWYPDVMTQSALKSMIYILRKKLPVDGIKTYSKEGYLFQCE